MSQPRLTGCSPLSLYETSEKLGEGTFGHVHKGVFKPTGTAVALKQILVHDASDGMPITALREIKLMKALRHPNVLHLLDMAFEKKRHQYSFYMVMRYMDHDLCGLLHNRDLRFPLSVIKLWMQQIVKGVAYLHSNQYMHRDMKSANVLVSNDGNVKVADFGLARHFVEPAPTAEHTSPATRRYTSKVVTRWYRPPELLLGEARYTPAIDMWGVGCVFGEIFNRGVVLAGHSDHDQLLRIFELVGSPTERNMPGFAELPNASRVMPIPVNESKIDERFATVPSDARDLLKKCLMLDPQKRITALGALEHPFFTSGHPAAQPSSVPEFPSSREMDYRRKRERPQSPPEVRRDTREVKRRRRAFAARLPDAPDLPPRLRIPPYKRRDNL